MSLGLCLFFGFFVFLLLILKKKISAFASLSFPLLYVSVSLCVLSLLGFVSWFLSVFVGFSHSPVSSLCISLPLILGLCLCLSSPRPLCHMPSESGFLGL